MGLKLIVIPWVLDKSPSETNKELQDKAKSHGKGDKDPLERKGASIERNVFGADKETLIAKYRQESDELFEYCKEVSACKLHLDERTPLSNDSAVACVLEESNLPFSKLVDEIYGKLKTRGWDWERISLASVRSTVLSVGQRVMYGIPYAAADVLEDESYLCLWCWETRDLKLLPVAHQGILSIQRTGREKIHARISAVSGSNHASLVAAMLSALSIPESHESYKSELLKASEKLEKAKNVMEIRSLIESLKQKNDVDMCAREAKPKEVFIKERCQAEKGLNQLQKEAEKEQRHREKEQAKLGKQLKRQKKEAERDQRRREKEEAELRKQLALKKQAAIMERFLKSKKSNDCSDNSKKMSSTKAPITGSSCKMDDLVEIMDCAISEQEGLPAAEDLRKLHVAGWHKACYSNRSNRWGVRQNPKVELIKELKLKGSSTGKVATPNKGPMLVDKWEETIPNEISYQTDAYMAPTGNRSMVRKLLHFDNSPRPAYYGTWHRKSSVVRP